jgi:trans-2,3-dihydro-3-hydroxyanthranilate isomerase
MKYKYYIVDVFSPTQFAGNQLAVLPEASGISPKGMQKIAREFNFAETAFVLPPVDPDHTCRVRIFTPNAELAFAGHPTVGTACALAMGGHCGPGHTFSLTLEEGVGPVAVDVEQRGGTWSGVLTLTGGVEQPDFRPSNQDIAAVLSLQSDDVVETFFASVGVPFCFAQLTSREAVDRAVIDRAAWTKILAHAWSPDLFFFSGKLTDGAELYARMCAPSMGIEEDPATGSACAALVGAMLSRSDKASDTVSLSVIQGVAMGRRSEIQAVARKAGGEVTSISVGGATAYTAAGEIEVGSAWLDI